MQSARGVRPRAGSTTRALSTLNTLEVALRERMAKLEGLLEELRDSIAGRRDATPKKGAGRPLNERCPGLDSGDKDQPRSRSVHPSTRMRSGSNSQAPSPTSDASQSPDRETVDGH